MTETSISLISILCGIAGANVFGYFFKKQSLGLTGNTIIGVFGSILFTKSTGQFGLNPTSIMESGDINLTLIIGYLAISITGGALGTVFISYLKSRYFQ